MPRRRSGSGGMRNMRSPQRSNLPAAPPPAAAQPYQQPRQPGLMGQMAATAGGVAIGSVVGHTVGAALSGGNNQQDQVQAAPVQNYPPQPYSQGYQQNPCQQHIDNLLKCSNTETDIGMCSAFSEAMKDCQRYYGL